jgi:anti-sigma regulatory factor (Ser/Thr protein kinase)
MKAEPHRTGHIRRRVPARADQLAGLRTLAAEFLARCLTQDRCRNAAAAITEACGNSIRHAYPLCSGDMELSVDVTPSCAKVRVGDWGVGIDARSPDPGLGLGMGLISDAADDLRISSSNAGTVLEMRFNCADHPACPLPCR